MPIQRCRSGSVLAPSGEALPHWQARGLRGTRAPPVDEPAARTSGIRLQRSPLQVARAHQTHVAVRRIAIARRHRDARQVGVAGVLRVQRQERTAHGVARQVESHVDRLGVGAGERGDDQEPWTKQHIRSLLDRLGRAAKPCHRAAIGTLTTGTGCRFAVSKT